MDTASFQFVFFGLTAAVVSNFSRSHVWRSGVLMLASLTFLGLIANRTVVLIPLAAFLLLGFAGLKLVEGRRAWASAWCVPVVILIYVWLKKYTFLPEASFISFPYLTLGLSYVFFRVLHLLIEAKDNPERAHVGPSAYLLYTTNFTTLVSGPIQSYNEFARDQFAEVPLPLGPQVVGLQLERIVRGFFKVNVLAMLLHAFHQDALAEVSQPLAPTWKIWAAARIAVIYPLFLYCNFSGYIDIVIALARLMRMRLPENFDRPFAAPSAIAFWNQWHMTLSNWLKMYVYNPLLLTLMRRLSSVALQPYLGVLCFFVTFFLIGVWHGRTSEFVVFGLLTGGGMSINKIWQLWLTKRMGRKGYKTVASNPLYITFGRGLNYAWFGFTLFWFWGNWRQIDKVFGELSLPKWLAVWLIVWLGATAVLAVWEGIRYLLLVPKLAEEPLLLSRYARVVFVSALGLIAVVMTVLLNQPAPDIVYKAF